MKNSNDKEANKNAPRSPQWPSLDKRHKSQSNNLRWRIVTVLLVASLLPLGLVALGSSVVFSRLLMDKTLAHQQNMVRNHAAAIDLYLDERLKAIAMVTLVHSIERLSNQDELQIIFDALNDSYDNAFVDLGLIDDRGHHLAYVGPYDLLDRNYRQAEWFQSVMSDGSYISDVFLGFRREPHCVIAVRQKKDAQTWVIRATINNDSLYSLVKTGEMGETGDAFIVNMKGLYQTPPRMGTVLGPSSITNPTIHQGVRSGFKEVSQKTTVQVTTWINSGRWLLVVQQSEDEIMSSVRHAIAIGGLVVLVAVILLAVTTFLATWHLTNKIDRAREQRDAMSRDLMRSAKLASLGEMASGLAHEINNPLAIINAEQTNIGDQIDELNMDNEVRMELMESISRCKRQVARCGGITAKMLRFGRKTDSTPIETNIKPLLSESVQLMRKQAEINNIDLDLEIKDTLPLLLLDGNELEQVMVNLIGNSIYAIGKDGKIRIIAERRDDEVMLSVEDNGCGIPQNDLDKIFQPFFTSKPVGKGTGLGLSVCYGIVRGWRGTIEASSELNKGTVMRIRLPVPNIARPT